MVLFDLHGTYEQIQHLNLDVVTKQLIDYLSDHIYSL